MAVAMMGLPVCDADSLRFLEDITLFKSQTHSVGKWALDDKILYLRSGANLIPLGLWDVLATKA